MNCKKQISLMVLSLTCCWFFGCSGSKTATLEQSFADMIGSTDMQTRISAIILIADLKETPLTETLIDHLKISEGTEKTATLYTLSVFKENYVDSFIDSIPLDEMHIKELLKAESPEKSYFREPHFAMVRYLGDLAIYNNKALDKLKAFQPYADGWQGDEIMGMLKNAEKSR